MLFSQFYVLKFKNMYNNLTKEQLSQLKVNLFKTLFYL
jgi:hypothetical protein